MQKISTSLLNDNLSGRVTQCRREMMVDRWRGVMGRVDDGVAPGKGYRDFVSYFGMPVSEFLLAHRDELIDEISDSDVGERGEETG
jgi:hypothetical protein